MGKLKELKDILLIFLFISVTTLIFYINNPQNPSMLGLIPHPYFVISILIAAFYGFKQALFTSVLSTVLYFILLNGQLDYDEVETIIDFEYLSMPLAMILISMLVGELKQRTIQSLEEAKISIKEKEAVIEDQKRQTDIYKQELSEMKDRLVSKLETMEEVYDIGLGLFKNNIDELIPNFLVILHQHLSIEGASLYIVSDKDDHNGLFKLAKGFPFTDKFPEEVNVFATKDPLIRQSYKNKKMVTIRDIMKKEDFDVWDKNTLISVPIIQNGEVHALLNIHRIPFLKYTPITFKKINLLVRWLGQAMEYAMNYEGYSKYSVLDETLFIFKNDYFIERLEEEILISQQLKSPLCLIKLEATNFEKLNEVKKVPYRKILSDICLRLTKKRDCVAEGSEENEIFLILPNTSMKEGEDLKEKILSEIYKFNFFSKEESGLDFKISNHSFDKNKSADAFIKEALI